MKVIQTLDLAVTDPCFLIQLIIRAFILTLNPFAFTVSHSENQSYNPPSIREKCFMLIFLT